MRRFNLSEWALANRPLVLFAMLAFALIGIVDQLKAALAAALSR